MKLLLANNHSEKFVDFYQDLQTKSSEPFDYSSYSDLLFIFDDQAERSIAVHNLKTGRELGDYDGVYINGYLPTYELAATVAIACDARGIGFANQELAQPPSLSKLSMHGKLTAAGVSQPTTIAGTKNALLLAGDLLNAVQFPAVLKRADADRGIDNFLLQSADELAGILASHEDRSLWVLQQFIDNNGFYLVSFYGGQPKFCIFRSLEERPDGNAQKAHMYKPKGGANAQLVELPEVPRTIIETCQSAVEAMNRQIASVDCIYDAEQDKAYVLEVNYNPQLVTITTLKDVRVEAFLDYLPTLGQGLQ